MSAIEGFLKKICEAAAKDDRGYLATLRRGLSDTTQEQAWPLVAPWCPRFDDETSRKIWCTIGGAAALLCAAGIDTDTYASLGSVMRQIALGTKQQNPILSFEPKFRRILNSPDSIDLCNLVVGVVRTAERKDIRINCLALFWHLVQWNDSEQRERIRIQWACDFYQRDEIPAEESPSTEETSR